MKLVIIKEVVYLFLSAFNNCLTSADKELIGKLMEEMNYVPLFSAEEKEQKKIKCQGYQKVRLRNDKDLKIALQFPNENELTAGKNCELKLFI